MTRKVCCVQTARCSLPSAAIVFAGEPNLSNYRQESTDSKCLSLTLLRPCWSVLRQVANAGSCSREQQPADASITPARLPAQVVLLLTVRSAHGGCSSMNRSDTPAGQLQTGDMAAERVPVIIGSISRAGTHHEHFPLTSRSYRKRCVRRRSCRHSQT